jgi:hypothetical protein
MIEDAASGTCSTRDGEEKGYAYTIKKKTLKLGSNFGTDI